MKVNMTKKRMVYTIAVTLIVVFSTTFAILMTLERMDYRNYLQGEYSKNMYELINSMDNIEDSLSKSAITGTREQRILVFEEIYRYSSRASDKLHSLPIAQETINETSKFLAQVGDYCYALVKAGAEGRDPSNEEYDTIDRLEQQSFELKENLNNVLADINEGRVQWGEIRKKASGVLAKENEKLVSDKFKTIQKQVTQYPSLIYDGPYSDNILDIDAKVNNLDVVSQQQAEEAVRKIIGEDRVENIQLRNTEGQTKIIAYSFNVNLKGRKKEENIVCEISKHGGKIVYLIDNRNLSKPNMDVEKARNIGAKFLEDRGYKSMEPTYTLTYEDSITVNYVYKVNEVMVYPDQIKLKIAMDDGSIIGVESEKYLTSHDDNRKIPNAKISQEDGRKNVSQRLQINSVRLAIVPTETNKELLCYEYSGTYKDENFMVYINAENGDPQRILKIINTPNGQLTM